MKNIITSTVFILLVISSVAQVDVKFDKDNFPGEQKDQLKDAIKNMRDADKYLEEDFPLYQMALKLYLKANEFNPDNALLNYKIGYCYLNTLEKTSSLPYLERAKLLDPTVRPDLIYLLARSYHLNLRFDEAIEQYNEYKGNLSPYELSKEGKDIAKKIKECETAKILVSNPIRIFRDNMGPQVNSKYPEYGPYINAGEDVLMFTSTRDNTTGGKIDPLDGRYFEDIYISYKEGDVWKLPVNPGKPLNTDSHDAIVGVSADGKHALIYKGEDNGGDIFDCRIDEDGAWSNPKRLPKEINTEFHESSASFSPSMDALYFVSNKPGGFGGRDIYVADVIKKEGKDKIDYEEARNLGPVINTEYDEQGVFMHPNGKILFFSSKGHNTMGDYDIFSSVFEDGEWSKPRNIGYPVNTPDADVFFSISEDLKHGYYSSFDPDGYGEKDLYMITFLGPEKPMKEMIDFDEIAHNAKPARVIMLEDKVELMENQIAIITGTVMDAVTLSPLGGVIVEIYDNELGRQVAGFESNSRTGDYMVSLPSGKNYGIAVKAKEYMFHSENLLIPPSTSVQEIYMDIKLNKVEVGSRIILKNIFFDFDKATLRPESAAELDRLYKLLNDVPTLRIEISGHTDNIGSAVYNQKLSEERAGAVVDYLIRKGVNPVRLTYKGYGKEQPIATNETEEGRQMNRRTEFRVLSR